MLQINMESIVNTSFPKNVSWDLPNIYSEFNTLSYNDSSTFCYVSERNTTGNCPVLYQIPSLAVVVLGLFYGAICATAILANLLVFVFVLASRKMQTVTNLFVANLALADIFIVVFAIPFQFQVVLLQKWNLPQILCAICPFVQVLSVTVSILTLVVIALDRYRAVMNPFKAKSSKKMALGAILAVWGFGCLSAFPTELDYSVVNMTENGRSKDVCTKVNLPTTFRVHYNQGIVIFQYFLPLFIISIAYFRIGRTLLRSSTPGNQEELRDALVLRKKKKVIKMIITVVVTFALCWFPLQSYNFLSVIFPYINSFEYINIMWFCFHCLAMSNSCCNPFIYAFYNNKFKTELIHRIPWLVHILQICCSQSDVLNAKIKNNCSVVNVQFNKSNGIQLRRFNVKVKYNPIQTNVLAANNGRVFEENSSICKIEMGVTAI